MGILSNHSYASSSSEVVPRTSQFHKGKEFRAARTIVEHTRGPSHSLDGLQSHLTHSPLLFVACVLSGTGSLNAPCRNYSGGHYYLQAIKLPHLWRCASANHQMQQRYLLPVDQVGTGGAPEYIMAANDLL